MAAETTFDQMINVALRSLHDIAVPQPVSWQPQAWGWFVLLFATIAAVCVVAWFRWQRYRKNAYRREALRLLDQITSGGDGVISPLEQMEELAEVLKRTALAVWERKRVARLTGADWSAFLNAASDGPVSPGLARLLDDLEYQNVVAREEFSLAVEGARRWIETHHV